MIATGCRMLYHAATPSAVPVGVHKARVRRYCLQSAWRVRRPTDVAVDPPICDVARRRWRHRAP